MSGVNAALVGARALNTPFMGASTKASHVRCNCYPEFFMRRAMPIALVLAAFGFVQPCLAAADPACTAEIRAIMLASVTSGPYHISARISGGGIDTVSTLDMIPPSAVHSVSTSGGQSTEMTFVDGRGFMKMSGVWTELPSEMTATMMQVFDTQTVEQSFGNIISADCAGTTAWEGLPALRYAFSTGPEATRSDITMWIDATTRLPLRIETVSPVEGGTATTISDYRYDLAITIRAPL
jgi:hypothetical protein